MGILYVKQGQHQEAGAMYKRPLKGKEKAGGPEHALMLGITNNLGTLAYQGRYEEAEVMYERVLEDHEKALGEDASRQPHESPAYSHTVLHLIDHLDTSPLHGLNGYPPVAAYNPQQHRAHKETQPQQQVHPDIGARVNAAVASADDDRNAVGDGPHNGEGGLFVDHELVRILLVVDDVPA
ncbi:hypothetical protein VTI28DRAFT_9054 [Corynascus sepedonium]